MLNEKVCVGYVNNSRERRSTVRVWQELYEAMPIGVPLTATEIAEMASERIGIRYCFSYQNIPPMAKAVGSEVIKREKIAIEPYEVEVEYFDHWDRGADGGYREVMAKKKIVVSEKTVYTRLV
jgi:hypothetical protein